MNYLEQLKQGAVRVADGVRSRQHLLLIALITMLLMLPASALLPQRPVDVLVFEVPLIHSEHAAVKEALRQFTPAGFWATDVYEIAGQVTDLSWVDAANVSKVWPNKLSIDVELEKPVARWNESSYLNGNGKVVSSFRAPIKLPSVYSSTARGAQAVELLLAIESQLEQVTELRLDKSGAITAQLDNGIDINFGAEAFVARLERVRRLLTDRAREGRQIKSIDARYPNGLAVVWREGLVGFTSER